MFYEHNVEQARKESSMRIEKANGDLAEAQILHLEDIVRRGLPDCYESFEDFLFDFYPNFSWSDAVVGEINRVLNDKRFPAIVAGIKEKFDFDMKYELEDYVKHGWGE